MTAARRVRCARTDLAQVGRIPRARPVLIVEYPRIVSTCAGRPPIWEWRLQFGRLADVVVGKAIRR